MVDTTQSFTKQVLELTNDFREENGLEPLKWDPELTEAAQEHSENMGEQDFFDHTGKDGSQPWDRTKAAGDDNNRVGENIAAGQRTPEEVVEGWKNSPGHRANMLNPDYEYIGVGYHQQKPDTGNVNYQHYWTQDFGGGGTPPAQDSNNDEFGMNDNAVSSDKNDIDMLMGKNINETLAGDFGPDNIVTNDTSGGIENSNPASIEEQNQSQNFQEQQDSMLPIDTNGRYLGISQLSSEQWMSFKNDFLAELSQSQNEQYADFTNHHGDLLSNFFG